MRAIREELRAFLGIGLNTTGHGEKLISALGAFLGIVVVCWVSRWYLDTAGGLMVVASMGASAVLLFAVPHGALSQPWALLGGHLVSASVGVSCQLLFPDLLWTPAMAVGLAVGAMYYLRCIHPPGGATALAAVVGGQEIHAMGYGYLLTPVLLNTLCLLFIAVVFNACFHWRRYPAHWVHRRQGVQIAAHSVSTPLTQEDVAAAMAELNSYVDVSAEELTELFERALHHAETHASHPTDIVSGHYYSNGRLGRRWSIRQVIDTSGDGEDIKHGEQLIYKVVAGEGAGSTEVCSREVFRQWASFEVVQDQGRWLKVQARDTCQE